jgi:Na+/H+ antiporter NhaC
VRSSERVVEETETVVLGGGDVSKMRLYILGAIFVILLILIAVWEIPMMSSSPAKMVETSKGGENSTFEVES